MSKGLDNMANKKSKAFKASTGLRLKSGDTATIRFLTDIKEVGWGWFHKIELKSRLGKTYSKSVFCVSEDNKPCTYCDSPEQKISAVKKRILFWVYVYNILHYEIDADGKFEKVERYGNIFYKESIDDIMLLETGPGVNNYIETRILNWSKKYGTLCDRDYEWSREGSKMDDTTYDLAPNDPSIFPSNLLEDIKNKIIDLDVVMRETITLPAATVEAIDKKDIDSASLEEEISEVFRE